MSTLGSILSSTEVGEHILQTPTVAPTISISVSNAVQDIVAVWTADQNSTVNISGTQKTGTILSFIITNDAVSGRTTTFGTGLISTGVLSGQVSKISTVKFISNGTNFIEVSRIANETSPTVLSPFILSSILTPAALSAHQDNYNPSGFNSMINVLRLSTDGGNFDITGLTAQATGTSIAIFNVGASGNIKLKKENASSTAANRFAIAADATIAPNESTIIWYDVTSSRWRIACRY